MIQISREHRISCSAKHIRGEDQGVIVNSKATAVAHKHSGGFGDTIHIYMFPFHASITFYQDYQTWGIVFNKVQ